MQLCICSCRWFEETLENSFLRKIILMQPMQLLASSGRHLEETFEKSFREESWKEVIIFCIFWKIKKIYFRFWWNKPRAVSITFEICLRESWDTYQVENSLFLCSLGRTLVSEVMIWLFFKSGYIEWAAGNDRGSGVEYRAVSSANLWLVGLRRKRKGRSRGCGSS